VAGNDLIPPEFLMVRWLLHLAPPVGRLHGENPQVSLDVTLSDRFIDLVEEGM